MTKIKYILLPAILATTLFTSCLDEDPSYSVNSATVFNNSSSAQMALNAIYGQMSSQGTFAQLIAEINSDCTGLTWAVYNAADNRSQYTAGYIPVENEFNDLVWDGLYKAVSSCNNFISNCESSDAEWDSKANMIAQARFIRGVAYYHLMTFYGGVPLRIQPTTTATVSMPRASRQQVIDQIVKDWTEAQPDLSPSMTLASGVPTAPSQGTVDAYLTKLYWTLGCNAWAAEQGDKWATGVLKKSWPEMKSSHEYFTLAKKYGDMVIDRNCFDLEPSFRTLFGGQRVSFSREFVFVVDATMNTSNNVAYNSLNWTFSPSNSTPGITWNRSQPNKAWHDYCFGTYGDDPRLAITFTECYEKYSDGTPTGEYSICYPATREVWKDTIDWEYIYGRGGRIVDSTAVTRDSIVMATLDYSKFADPTNPTLEEIGCPDPNDPEDEGSRFYQNYCNMTSGASYQNSKWSMYWKHHTLDCTGRYANNNIYVYRYADFLLLYADVLNELGLTDQAQLVANRVLQRARNSTENGVAATCPRDWQGLTQDEVRHAIFNERLFELAAEFDGFNDTRRRGINWRRPLLERSNNHHVTRASYESSKSINYGGDSREYFYPNYGAYGETADWDNYLIRNMLLPIPRNEINSNDDISETNQNPGYAGNLSTD